MIAESNIQTIDARDYKIYLGDYSLQLLGHFLETQPYHNCKFFVLVDENTLRHCFPVLIDKVEVLRNAEVLEITSGEDQKNIEVASGLWEALVELEAGRDAVLINLGGGVIGDMGGFVAGTFKRGIRYIQVPTTLLAQVDAAVGGKTGIDLGVLKNAVGLFNPPEAVFVHNGFLHSLSPAQLRSGMAEMLKHALIEDAQLWKQLKNAEPYPDIDIGLLHRSIQIKNNIVLSDPLEKNHRKKLNFGHTIGHAIESYSLESSNRTLLHGEAVAIGMICEAFISHRHDLLSTSDLKDICASITRIFPHFPFDSLVHHRLLELMKQDKKNRQGKINFTLLNGIGGAIIDQEVQVELIIGALDFYNSLT